MNNENIIHYNGEQVNLYDFSNHHPNYSMFVIKGTWYQAFLYMAVSGENIKDTDEALRYSYTDSEFDVVDKNELNLGKVGGIL